ncbi:hypothetical protein IPV26_16580 [Brucella pituitosa]|uniref:Uncharacterized protein n=1 Tax=Brucella pituitosa TaxID=571256 RepID=A0ABS3K301_9HYPH|nr:hypothetical protein [Brucella pituitosa]
MTRLCCESCLAVATIALLPEHRVGKFDIGERDVGCGQVMGSAEIELDDIAMLLMAR